MPSFVSPPKTHLMLWSQKFRYEANFFWIIIMKILIVNICILRCMLTLKILYRISSNCRLKLSCPGKGGVPNIKWSQEIPLQYKRYIWLFICNCVICVINGFKLHGRNLSHLRPLEQLPSERLHGRQCWAARYAVISDWHRRRLSANLMERFDDCYHFPQNVDQTAISCV